MDFRVLKYSKRQKLKDFRFKDFKDAYFILVNALKEKYKEELVRTLPERQAYTKIRSECRVSVERSIWIGPRNIDLFIPSMRFDTGNVQYLGVAIEIDGSIHDRELKMKKDSAKYSFLESLKILPVSIRNEDINNGSNIFKGILESYYPDSRSKLRLMRKIHIQTILYHKDLIRSERLSKCQSIIDILEDKDYGPI